MPFLPNFDEMLDLGAEMLADLPLNSLESLEEPELFLKEEDMEGLLEDLEDVVEGVVGRFHLVINFRLVLPIACVNSLDEGMEFVESCGFSDLRDLILDMIRKTIEKVVPEGTFSVTPNL